MMRPQLCKLLSIKKYCEPHQRITNTIHTHVQMCSSILFGFFNPFPPLLVASLLAQSLLTPDSPEEVAMDIRTVTYTPTSSQRGGRKRLSGDGGGGAMGRGSQGTAGGGGNGDHASATATPRLSGYGGSSGGGGGGSGSERDANITLKLWDFGGTEEFHAVHGLFFSG